MGANQMEMAILCLLQANREVQFKLPDWKSHDDPRKSFLGWQIVSENNWAIAVLSEPARVYRMA